MEKEIVGVQTDEATKITRVHYADGTFDAFPAGTFPAGAVSVEVTEEPANEGETLTGSVVNDLDAMNEDADDFEIQLGNYRVIGEIPFTDEDGNEKGMTEIGSVQTVPVALGEYWVSEGLAERVTPDVNDAA